MAGREGGRRDAYSLAVEAMRGGAGRGSSYGGLVTFYLVCLGFQVLVKVSGILIVRIWQP